MTTKKLFMQAYAGIPGIGMQTLRKLQSFRFFQKLSWPEMWRQPLDEVLTAVQQHNKQAFVARYTPRAWQEWLESRAISSCLPGEESYPFLLRHCLDHPELLFVKGNAAVLAKASLPISIVGTRKMTALGERTTQELVAQLQPLRPTVVSGFMVGVDCAAHRAAQHNSLPSVGILGYGIDGCYPASLFQWQQQFIESGGVLVSEYPPGMPAQKGLFRLRNRIVAGMSYATVVAEAGYPSGTFITATYAAEYGRLLGVVPLPSAHPLSAGIQKLVEDGASQISSVSAFWDELRPSLLPSPYHPFLTLSPKKLRLNQQQMKLFRQIQSFPGTAAELVLAQQLSLLELLTVLRDLEQKRLVVNVGGRWYSNPLALV